MRKTKDVLRWARRIVVLGLSISPIAHAQTATTVIDTKAAASGQCSDFGTPQTNLHSCDEKVFYIHYSNGRVSFIVQKTFSDEDQKNDPTGEYRAGRKQVVMFSGSRDQQNHPEDYYLYVDNVSINLYDVSDNSALGNNEVPVSGNCHLVGNAEMSHIQRITCSATYG